MRNVKWAVITAMMSSFVDCTVRCSISTADIKQKRTPCVEGFCRSVCDLVSAPKSLDRYFLKFDLGDLIEVAGQFRSSFILVNKKAYFTRGPKWTVSYTVLENVYQILMKFDMGDVCITLVGHFDFGHIDMRNKAYFTYCQNWILSYHKLSINWRNSTWEMYA
jgi:hypothetical protein